ncbi:MAG TPA: hypothetical protein VLI45_08950 [Acidobacteriaceae bacterium]|nr:hypothetical protein [Acidobacteriaceae bacterium]
MNEFQTQVLTGAPEILRARPLLEALAAKTGQVEAVSDFHYYLGKPGLLNRRPVLLLFTEDRSEALEAVLPGSVMGAALLFEYQVAGISTAMYTSNDRSGRRTVIAMPEHRLRLATAAAAFLLERRAHIVMLSVRVETSQQTCDLLSRTTPLGSWVYREREVAEYLPLCSTFDATLAQIGKRTRTHMRYYRRRAEEQLGCIFLADANVSDDELLQLNRESVYPVPEQLAIWRRRALDQFSDPILMGLRDGEGRWMALLGGRRLNGDTEILWQMNRSELRSHSLSLVLRTYLIEHEISAGSRRLYLDGGSGHSISHSFVTASVTDVAAMRPTLLSFAARKVARKVIPWDNELAHLLVEPQWQPNRTLRFLTPR